MPSNEVQLSTDLSGVPRSVIDVSRFSSFWRKIFMIVFERFDCQNNRLASPLAKYYKGIQTTVVWIGVKQLVEDLSILSSS